MTALRSRSVLPLIPTFLFVLLIWVLSISVYRWHWLVGLFMDLVVALGLWVSVFSGMPLLAWWAEKRAIYERYAVQTQTKLFHFLMLFTGRLGWIFAFRSLGGLFGLVSRNYETYWILSGVLLIVGEFYSLRRLLLTRTFHQR